ITPAVSKALESAFTKFTLSLDGIIYASLKAFADARGQAKKHAVPLIFGEGGTGVRSHAEHGNEGGTARFPRSRIGLVQLARPVRNVERRVGQDAVGLEIGVQVAQERVGGLRAEIGFVAQSP